MHHAGDFRRVCFSESLFNSHENDVILVITLAMVAFFWRDGVLNTFPICHFTMFTKSVMKYAFDKFFIDCDAQTKYHTN